MTMTRRTILGGIAAAMSLAGFRAARAATTVSFSDLYVSGSGLTPYAEELAGTDVELTGFMAPPLRAEMAFFVLTVEPMGICPFCDSEATWPEGIVAVHTGGPFRAERYDIPIVASGRLDLGFAVDRETGFGSLIRIIDADYRRYQ